MNNKTDLKSYYTRILTLTTFFISSCITASSNQLYYPEYEEYVEQKQDEYSSYYPKEMPNEYYEEKDDEKDEFDQEHDNINFPNSSNNYYSSAPQEKFVKRDGELMIPADGDCLFTSVLVGYLLPVLKNREEFNMRCRIALGKEQIEKRSTLLHEKLRNYLLTGDLEILKSNYFKTIMNTLKASLGIKGILWGGGQEIQKLSDKLQIAIQEYTPDSAQNNKILVESDLTIPKTCKVTATVEIVQDIAAMEESAVGKKASIEEILATIASINEQEYRQHFRLKIDESVINQVKVDRKNSDSFFLSEQYDFVFRGQLKYLTFDCYIEESLDEVDDENKNYKLFYKNLESSDTKAIFQKMKEYDQMPSSIEKYIGILWCYLSYLSFQKEKELMLNLKFRQARLYGTSYPVALFRQDIMIINNSVYWFKQKDLLSLCKNIRNLAKSYKGKRRLKDIVASNMDGIEAAIMQKKLQLALRETNLLMKKVELVNIRSILFYVKEAEEASNIMQNKNVILLIGPTRVGKTTTLLYLMKCKMNEVKQKNLTQIEVDQNSVPDRYIDEIKKITTNPQDRSLIRHITGIKINPKDFGLNKSKHQEVILCEAPDFNAILKPEEEIARELAFIKAIRKAKGVTIALLLSERYLYVEAMKPVKKLVSLIVRMVPSFTDHHESFTYLFTQVAKKTKAQINTKFKVLLQEEAKGTVESFDSISKAIFEDIRNTTAEEKPWIVDPMRTLEDTPTSEEILDRLVNKATYINNPEEVFNNYISLTSWHRLGQQLAYHKDAILAAIKEKNFPLAQYKLDEVQSIEKLLNNKNISYAYLDVTQEASKLWNDIARNSIDLFKNHMLSEKPVERKQIHEYLTTFKLYKQFDKKLRKKHLDQDTISNDLFLIEFKDMLAVLGAKVLDNPLANPFKTKLYMQKINVIADILYRHNSIVWCINQILFKYLEDQKKKALDLITQNKFEKIYTLLSYIKQSSSLQEVLNEEVGNIQVVYKTIKNELLEHITKKVKNVCKILGKEYQEAHSKEIEAQNNIIPKNSSRYINYLNRDDVSMIEDEYSIIEKADITFRGTRQLSDVATQIQNIRNQFLIISELYVKHCGQRILTLLKPTK